MKKGFTIVEMLMVIAVLAILMGIVTSAATTAIRQSRNRRADAMRAVIETGITAYRARMDEWPGVLDSWSKNGVPGSDKKAELSPTQYDDVLLTVVRASVGSSAVTPFIDPTGLFVANKTSANSNKGFGRDFKEAIKKGNNRNRITLSNMAFGYASPKRGYFFRYKISYNGDADTISVSRDTSGEGKYDK